MKLKILNLLTASFATLGLLTLPASAFAYKIEHQASIKETQSLMNGIGNSEEVNRKRTQTKRVVREDKFVAVTSRKTQFNQPNLAKQPPQSLSFLVGMFMIFVIIGFISGCFGSILGCLFQYRQYKKFTKQKPQILLVSENLERMEKMNVPLREKQIEILERIWKMKP